MPFQFQAYDPTKNIGTLSELMLEPARARARALEAGAAAQAQAAQISGQAAANAATNIGNTVSGTINQLTDPRRQLEATQLAAAQRDAKSRLALETALKNPDNYKEDGTIDDGKVGAFLNKNDIGAAMQWSAIADQHRKEALDTTKAIIDINKGNLDINEKQQAIAQKQADFLGRLAYTGRDLIRSNAADPLHARDTALASVAYAAAHPVASGVNEDDAKRFVMQTASAGPQQLDQVFSSVIPPELEAKLDAEKATTVKNTAEAKKAAAEAQNITQFGRTTPGTPEEQYVTAVAKGDTAGAKTLLDAISATAQAKRDPVAMAQLEALRNLNQQTAQARLDDMNPQSPKNQQKFEQEYRTVLQRAMSNRSGGIGLEDAKVQQANHLLSIFEQNYDPKTGGYDIPRVQLNELALGLARLTSPGGQAGEQMMKEFQQRTAKGDLAGALTYWTGEPISANTQDITKMLKDSIERQGRTADTNRNGELAYLRGLAPTDLNETRRTALESTSLNPLRQIRIAKDANGNSKMFVSTDGGATWK